MRKRGLGKYIKLVLLAVAIIGGEASTALAQTSKSDNYQAIDTEFGSMSNTQNCSTQYCAKASIGDMTAGDSKNTTSSAKFGSVVESDPLLEVIVDSGVSNLGTLTAEQTAYKTSIVRVRSYLSDGYIMQIFGNAPKYGTHTLSTSATPVASVPGTEQFGINAALNTTPTVGANPVQVPSNQFSFGVVNSDYNVPNLFKYVNGGEIARSETESGQTDYTISMIVNVSNATPAGHYSGDFSIVVTPFY